jgi:hypothetical protein
LLLPALPLPPKIHIIMFAFTKKTPDMHGALKKLINENSLTSELIHFTHRI